MSILIVKNTFQRSDNDTVRPDIRLNDHIGDGGDKVFAGVIGDMPHVVGARNAHVGESAPLL